MRFHDTLSDLPRRVTVNPVTRLTTDDEAMAPPQDRTVPIRRWYLATTLVLLNLLDVWSTKWIISLGGEESNPLMKPIIDHPTAPLMLKLGLCILIGALVIAAPRERRFAEYAMFVVVGAYTLVIAWNVSVLIQALSAQG
jgi:hypothetical protein